MEDVDYQCLVKNVQIPKRVIMEELIKITEHKGNRAVSARELHRFLEVKEKFTDWIRRMFEYGFMENIDYQSLSDFSEKPNGGIQ